MSATVCPFCSSGRPVRVCRCQDAIYAQSVGLPMAKAAFVRKGGVLHDVVESALGPASPTLSIADLDDDNMVATVDAVRARMAKPSAENPLTIVLPPWSTPSQRDTILTLTRIALFGGDDVNRVEAAHGADPGVPSGSEGAGMAQSRGQEDGGPAGAPVRFVFNEDGTAPSQQPRGICPSCDTRHAHFDKMREAAAAKKKLQPGDT